MEISDKITRGLLVAVAVAFVWMGLLSFEPLGLAPLIPVVLVYGYVWWMDRRESRRMIREAESYLKPTITK